MHPKNSLSEFFLRDLAIMLFTVPNMLGKKASFHFHPAPRQVAQLVEHCAVMR